MELKKGLLRRLGLGRGNKNGQSQMPKTAASKAEVAKIFEQTILARQITLSGKSGELIFYVANGKIFGAIYLISGKAVFEHNFSQSPLTEAIQKKLARQLEVFFDLGVEFAISYKDVAEPADLEAGILPAIFFQSQLKLMPVAQETVAVEPVIQEPVLVPEAVEPLKPREPQTGVSLAQCFLEKAVSDTRSSRYYFMDPASPKPLPDQVKTKADAQDFSGINDLYKTFAPALGPNLFVVIVTESDTKDAFAFAMDGAETAVVEMSHQKIGRVCQAWQTVSSLDK